MAEYEVIIKNATDRKKEPVSLPNDEPSDYTPTPEKSRQKNDSGIPAAGLVAVNQITPYVTQAINFGISQITVTAGSTELQRKAQIVSSLVGTTASIGMAAAVGGIGGAAVMAGMQVLNGIISTGYNMISIENQKRIEDENISLKKSRAGLSVNRSRTGGTT